jgi:hypothetical protein
MNTKLLAPVVGALLLAGSTLALAHDRHGHGRPEFRGWHRDSWSRPDHHWNHYQQYRHYGPQPHGYFVPAPRHPSAYHGGPRGYGRDGVSIIFRGRIN